MQESRKRLLDPIERVSEVWFGLIMVLTYTCSLSITSGGHADVRDMLVQAIGCNFAWGIIDAFMYLAAAFSEHGQKIAAHRALRKATTIEDVRKVFHRGLPQHVADALTPKSLAQVREIMENLAEPAERPKLTREDWLGAFAVFLLVFVSTLPVVVPFVFIHEPKTALRISNTIAIALLFISGYSFGKNSGYRPVGMGTGAVIIGAATVAMTIRLGG